MCLSSQTLLSPSVLEGHASEQSLHRFLRKNTWFKFYFCLFIKGLLNESELVSASGGKIISAQFY